MGLRVKKDRLGNEEIMGEMDYSENRGWSWPNMKKTNPFAKSTKPRQPTQTFRKVTDSAGSFTKIGCIK